MTSSLKRKAGTAGAGSEPKKAKADSSIMSFFGAKASSSTSTTGGASGGASGGAAAATPFVAIEPPTFKFNKEKWVATLTDEQKKLLKLEIDTLDPSWLALLKDEIVSKEFLELKRFLDRETASGKKVFPPREDIYSWSRLTPFYNVKVVILGQDPYHNVNQAHGLAFSVRPPTPAPPSLANMYKALAKDYPTFKPPPRRGGLLTPWAERGVLMLNTCLTVRAHDANSHSNRGWERFTQRVIDMVATRRTRGVVFMAWGTPAGKRVVKVNDERHLVLKSVHPSPLSASRGFFDCGHFKKANEWLVNRYGEDGFIDWSLTEGESLRPGQDEDEKAEEGEAAKSPDSTKAKDEDEFGSPDIDSDIEDAIREAEAKEALKTTEAEAKEAKSDDVTMGTPPAEKKPKEATTDDITMGTPPTERKAEKKNKAKVVEDESETEAETETETETVTTEDAGLSEPGSPDGDDEEAPRGGVNFSFMA